VRNVRLMLQFVYTLQELYARVAASSSQHIGE